MYLMASDMYVCDYCQNEFGWEDETGVYGDLVGCANCAKTFCSKCFRERMGNDISHACADGVPRCPDCIRKVRPKLTPSLPLPKTLDMEELL